MNDPERALRHRITHSRGLLREIIDLADEQGWAYRVKDEGLLFFPPPAKARPGMTQIFAADPGNESHTQRIVKSRFRKAGLIFPEDEPRIRKPTMNVGTSMQSNGAAKPAEVQPATRFATARQKINAALSLLSEIEQLLGEIECDGQKLLKLRELLKDI